jgi:hypothetical protein
MPKTTKSSVDMKALNAHLETVDDDNLDEDDGYEACNASQGLETVRKSFYGTPFEQALTDAIIICDALAERVKKIG